MAQIGDQPNKENSEYKSFSIINNRALQSNIILGFVNAGRLVG